MNALAGVIPALLTPFTAAGESVDLDLLDAHLTWLAERGVRTVSPLGTTGEGVSLSLAERRTVIERIAAHPARLAQVPGTGCNALPETIELSRFALAAGAAGVLVAPPSYYEVPDARGTTAYLRRLFAELPAEARVVVYHIPRNTGVPITDETIVELRREFGPVLAGIKDSGGDLDATRRRIVMHRGLAVLNGSDATALPALRAGAAGALTMLANVVPGELQAIARGDDAERRQARLVCVRELLSLVPRHAALKELLHRVAGLPRSAVRPPLVELDAEHAALIETVLSELKEEVHV
jgi:4-hydroxy-tetrahydrodipicolinate synthase